MKLPIKYFSLLALSYIFLNCFNSTFAFELFHSNSISNLETTKQQLIQYYNSGKYLSDQTTVLNNAKSYLLSRLNSKIVKPLAIVLDIDETSLSNYPDMLKMSFGGTEEAIAVAEGKGKDPVIKPTLELYQFATSNKVAVFFVTGRRERFRSGTEANLKSAGFKQWNKLFMKPNDYHQHTAAIFKTKVRQQIENMGFDIVLNIGDQESDLVGGYADKTFKLPNPYYLVP